MDTPINLSQKEKDRLQVLLVLQAQFLSALKEAYEDINIITKRLEQWEQEISTIIEGSHERTTEAKGCAQDA